jgi:hypothetical protein
MVESTLTTKTPGILVASGYCSMFLYTFVPGRLPNRAVLGLVT